MFTSFAFIYLIGGRKRSGFIWGLVAAIAWIIVNVIADIWPGVVLNVVMVVLHVRGYLNWGKK